MRGMRRDPAAGGHVPPVPFLDPRLLPTSHLDIMDKTCKLKVTLLTRGKMNEEGALLRPIYGHTLKVSVL